MTPIAKSLPVKLEGYQATSRAVKNWPLWLVLLLGAGFRFPGLGYVRHGYDQGYQAYEALLLLDGRQLLLVGQPSSIFLDNPPLMAYLQAIPLLFWRSPWSVYLFVTVLNTIAIWFVYQAGRKVLGNTAGLLAAFLFAANPWVVHFSRFPWTQGLLPFFMAVVAWGLWPTLATERREPGHVFIALAAAAAMIQTYVLAFAILLPITILLVAFYRHIPKRPLYGGVAVIALTSLLFLAGLVTRAERNSTKLQDFLAGYEPGVNVEAAEHAARLVTGLDYTGQDELSSEPVRPQPFMVAAHVLLGLALLAGIGRALLAWYRNESERHLAVILLLWLLTPVAGLMFLPYPLHPHYLLLTLPAGHLLAAWGLLPLFQHPRLRWGALLLLLLVAGYFGLNLYRAGRAVAGAPAGYGFNGWALAEAARVGAAIRELAVGQNFPRRIYAADHKALLSSMSATLVEPIEGLSFPDYVMLPGREPMLYVLVNQSPDAAIPGPLQETFPERSLHLRDGTQVSFLRVWPYDRPQALALAGTAVDWTSDAGLTLLGYDLDASRPFRAGGSFALTIYWRVEELHPDRDEWYVSPFYHVLNSEGQIVANVSEHGQWGYRWQPGDVYVERVVVPLPDYLEAGQYQLALGLFDPIHAIPFSLNSASGREPVYTVPIEVIQYR